MNEASRIIFKTITNERFLKSNSVSKAAMHPTKNWICKSCFLFREILNYGSFRAVRQKYSNQNLLCSQYLPIYPGGHEHRKLVA